MIAREQQVAEKIHAYTLPRNTANKDLVDLALLIESGGLEKQRTLDALLLTFERRGTHDLPAGLVPPSADWRIPFHAMAQESGLRAVNAMTGNIPRPAVSITLTYARSAPPLQTL